MRAGLKLTSLGLLIALALGLGIGCAGGQQNLSHLTKDELFALGKQKFDNKKYLDAIQAFQTLTFTYPGESIVDTAQYFLALSYYSNEDYTLAEAEFNRLVVNYPTSAYATQSQFMRAVSAFESAPDHYGLDQDKTVEAIRQLEDFIIDNPESELVADVNKYLALANERMARKTFAAAVVYTRMGAAKAAKLYYQKVIDEYTNSPYTPLASYNYAMEEMYMHNFEEARRRLESFVTAFPEHKLAAKARDRIAEAAFKAAELAFDRKDFASAATKFNAFKKDFPSDERVKKADQYLAKIGALPAETIPQANAQPK